MTSKKRFNSYGIFYHTGQEKGDHLIQATALIIEVTAWAGLAVVNLNKKSILTNDTIGSNNLSPGTSIQFISIAPGAPGEQGVNKSSTMTSWSFLLGPPT